MASLNTVMLIGNVGRDPEMRYTANGNAQTQFSLAVNYRKPPQGGGDQWEEATEWFRVVVWRDLAERVSQYVTKGRQVYVEGRLQTRTYDDDQGVKHYITEVVANQVLFLGGRDQQAGGGAGGDWGDAASPKPARGGRAGAAEVDPDDLPFE